ncbi:MAG: M67 family metallopeptidase [Erythrobacter sp.]
MGIEVTSDVMTAMELAAERSAPNEACGILLGDGESITALIPAMNVHPTPQTHFEIDPQALIDAHRATRNDGPLILGYFHSHPSGDPNPSKTDREMAAGDGLVWAIYGAGEIAFWRSEANGFVALSYCVTDG